MASLGDMELLPTCHIVVALNGLGVVGAYKLLVIVQLVLDLKIIIIIIIILTFLLLVPRCHRGSCSCYVHGCRYSL